MFVGMEFIQKPNPTRGEKTVRCGAKAAIPRGDLERIMADAEPGVASLRLERVLQAAMQHYGQPPGPTPERWKNDNLQFSGLFRQPLGQ